MRKINQWWLSFTVIAVLSACADDHVLDFAYEKPESLAQMEYLNDYEVLKSYVDRSENPNFKLGAGVTVSDYLEKGHVYRFINANFDGMTAGNAMKYNASVSDNGSMNFGTVTQFVEAAREAGLAIYGHTLLWHAQQNNVYLNKIIGDQEIEIDPDATEDVLDGYKDYAVEGFTGWAAAEVPVTPYVENGVLVVENPSAMAQNYFLQYHVAGNISIKEATRHKVTVRIKGTSEGSITLALGTWSAQQNTQLPVTTEWAEATVELGSTVNSSDAFVMLQSGLYVGTYEIAWVKVTHPEALAVTWWTPLITNGDLEGDDLSNFFATEATVGPNTATLGAAGTGADGVGRAIVVKSADGAVNNHDTQFFVNVDKIFQEGEKIRFTMKYRAEKAASSESQAHLEPGQYNHWSMAGSPSFTTEWKDFSYIGTLTADQVSSGETVRGMSTIAFNLAVSKEANTYYFDDISWDFEESGNKIPLTPQEKADTLTWAMENWIAGMFEATQGYVTEWDVVNEAISGTDQDGDGFYDLQSAILVSADEAASNFYWQDYLGDDFTRIAVELARKYGPANMKLFVNDYNLESDWDDNRKLKSLIHWIERWESDGTTVIDGIGTQMHVSYHMNPETQASKEEHIVKMFELMAATGKLIKVTELDMGLVGEDGVTVRTNAVTSEQHKAMSDHYKFIVQKYFEIIPAAQRYGITHWCPVDSPQSSSWRGGEPVGLWTESFRRKHTFGGFADGLAGE